MIGGRKQPWKTGKKLDISKFYPSVLHLADNAPACKGTYEATAAEAAKIFLLKSVLN